MIHRLSGVMNRASICHIKRICCRWQAALACWCSHQRAHVLQQHGLHQQSLHTELLRRALAWQQEQGTAFPLGGAKLAWCSSLLQEEPQKGCATNSAS